MEEKTGMNSGHRSKTWTRHAVREPRAEAERRPRALPKSRPYGRLRHLRSASGSERLVMARRLHRITNGSGGRKQIGLAGDERWTARSGSS